MIDKQFTDAEVEWAARCLEGYGDLTYHSGSQGYKVALRALQGGYVPPPRPVPVREKVAWVLRDNTGGAFIDWLGTADALLKAFTITPKEGKP